MNTLLTLKPLLALLPPLGLPLILVSSRSANIREAWTFIAALAMFAATAAMLPTVWAGQHLEYTLVQVLPAVSIAFRVDAFGLLFALVSSCLWIVTSLYSMGYMRGLNEHSQTRYYSFFALSLAAAAGVAFSANLLTLYLFYEMLSFATYPLVTHHQDREARASGRKYLLYILGASIGLVLPAMLIVFHLGGTLDFAPGGILAGKAGAGQVTVLLIMLVFGFAKAAVMPLHSWLPAAMVAPTPVSALLHAVAVVKVGVFSVLRVMTGIFGTGLLADLNLGTLVAAIAAVTILVASLIALSQDGLKRRLAFSTIGQLSYIVLGAALLSPSGLTGAMLHIAMHAFGKITLFFCAGAIFVATGKKYISEMKGIGWRMPLTMGAFFIGALSVIGLPPCGGFISKWHLVIGTLEADRIVFLWVILISSLLNAAYFLPIVYQAFFCHPEESLFPRQVREAPRWCIVPPLFTAAVSVILFFHPQPFLHLARLATRHVLGGF
jgi:multicomponent Na+:H+ antiporter subunit D